MCTISWLHQPDGYTLFCNRDEKKTRLPASPPVLNASDGTQYLAPVDGNHGGTWIAVNEFGLTLCLLNGKPRPAGSRSRGLLLPEWIASSDAASVLGAFTRANLSVYSPFTAVVLEPGRPALVLRWDGAKRSSLDDGEACMPLTSSSFDAAGAQVHRRMEFRRLLAQTGRLDNQLLRVFHSSHGSALGPLSACMHREDAETVSFTRVTVDAQAIRMDYSPSAPCKRVPSTHYEMTRVAACLSL
ncbi:MAG: NRDE family protein [Acidobacteria bacterium]|nr:NRDE family protein [Acidobacteriota bacterium]